MDRDTQTTRTRWLVALYLRGALSCGFLAAVTDRLGLWGPYGRPNIAWGDMSHFIAYAAKLNPWFPSSVIPVLAWVVTFVESLLGVALLVGYRMKLAARLSGWLLLAFAIGMTAGTGFKSALSASVFAASAGSFLLARSSMDPFSLDSLLRLQCQRFGERKDHLGIGR